MVGLVTQLLVGSVWAVRPPPSQPLYVSETDVRRTIEAAWEIFEPCEALVAMGYTPEPLTVSFVIEGDGLVSSAELTSPVGMTSEYASCLVHNVSTIIFPDHWENPIALRYVFSWGTQGLIKYPRVPLPQRLSLPLGLSFFGISTEALYDLLFEGDTANGNVD
jgi:hypothetical protein